MKTLKKIVIAVALLSPIAVFSQSLQDYALAVLARSTNTSRFLSALSTHQVLLVKYVGTSASGKVAVAANGDLTFTSGAEGAEAADASFECPVSGALGGIIDVSDAACNTLGEVVDTINGSCSTCLQNWKAVILDGLRQESSDDSLVTIAATAATSEDGLALLGDSAVSFDVVQALTPFRSIKSYLSPQAKMVRNPYAGTKPVLYKTIATSTYGSGTSGFEVWCVKPNLIGSGTAGAGGSDVETQVWSEAGGATTVAKTFDFTAGVGLACNEGEKLVVKLNNSAAMTAATMPTWAAQLNVR